MTSCGTAALTAILILALFSDKMNGKYREEETTSPRKDNCRDLCAALCRVGLWWVMEMFAVSRHKSQTPRKPAIDFQVCCCV